MKCEEARPSLVALVHGDLAPSEEPAVREHLGSCAACRAAEGEFHQIRALLRAVGHREANRSPHLWERAQILKAKVQALFDAEVAVPDAVHVSSSPGAAAAPVPRARRPSLKRTSLLVLALAAAGTGGFLIRQSSPQRHHLDRERLLAGPVRVDVERDRDSHVQVEGTRIDARGPAAYVARLWASRESFERDADIKSKEWAFGKEPVFSAWPILEVAAVAGLVTVENEAGNVMVTPGEVVFAPPHRFPLIRQ